LIYEEEEAKFENDKSLDNSLVKRIKRIDLHNKEGYQNRNDRLNYQIKNLKAD
jgi:hypothetical protein